MVLSTKVSILKDMFSCSSAALTSAYKYHMAKHDKYLAWELIQPRRQVYIIIILILISCAGFSA